MFDYLSRIIGGGHPVAAPVSGARLTRCGERAWIADRELIYRGRYRLPLRMVVLQDDEDGLMLYSPVALEEGTVEALQGIGEVRRIVVPNRFHTLFVPGAVSAFPEARLLLPTADAMPGELFADSIQPVDGLISIGSNLQILPVAQRDGLVELVVYHDPAELLVVSDLLFNFQQAEGLVRWFLIANRVWRRPAHSLFQRLLLLQNREALREFYRWAMSKPFNQISMSHGQLITGEAREVFYQLFHRFGA